MITNECTNMSPIIIDNHLHIAVIYDSTGSYRSIQMFCETKNIKLQISYYNIYASYFIDMIESHDVPCKSCDLKRRHNFRTLKYFWILAFWIFAKNLNFELKISVRKLIFRDKISKILRNFSEVQKFQTSFEQNQNITHVQLNFLIRRWVIFMTHVFFLTVTFELFNGICKLGYLNHVQT